LAWDDAKKAKAVEMYQEREPTPENSMEIVQEIAEELEESANGVRMILSKANVYIKKDPAKPSASSKSGSSSGGSTRVSKEDAHNALIAAISAHGQEADSEIVSKMTGKAAQHFTTLFNAIGSD
jgi:hypothetical protein